MKSSRLWCVALLIFGTAFLVQSFQSPAAVDEISATYSRGILHVAIPYDAHLAGAGRLSVEVLDPEDQSLGKVDLPVSIAEGKGAWRADVKLLKPLATGDLVWQRLRYQFTYSGAKQPPIGDTETISNILRMPQVRILGQQSYIAGANAAVRVIATDGKGRAIDGASSLRIELTANGATRPLYSGSLNPHGTTEPHFALPAGLTGAAELRYIADTPIGSTEFTQPIRLEDKTSILLTTEKPMYQPGQMIHARALVLNRANHEAVASRPLTFEVEDPRGNKVFKSATQTDKFGVASADFGLADEVNLGAYHLRAVMDGDNKSEITLDVEKYVLPKFKVALDFSDKVKHGYRPGDHVTGIVRSNYFFGKPVSNADISIKGTGIDVAAFDAGSAAGKADADGAYHFDLKLPDYFAGKPLAGGSARVLIEATVKDSAGHSETRGEPITVSTSPLIITAIPEGGSLAPGLDNQIFILTSYADGKPAATELKIHADGIADRPISTDESGIAMVHIKGGGPETLKIDARDKEGVHTSVSIPLQSRTGSDQILLRADKAVFRAGDRIDLKAYSTRQRGAVYLDAIKDGQTILTRDFDLDHGQAEFSMIATPALAGTVEFNAYLFGSDARPIADHRLIFVEPADELKIEATTDRPAYKPGDDARVQFRVTNSKGEGVEAALGVQVVDEAVFALAEKQPGFAKVFFYLEQEAMKPRYEIHSFGMPEIVETAQRGFEQRDRAARALFAATELLDGNKFETIAGVNVGAAKQFEYVSRYRARFGEQMPARLSQAYAHSSGDLVQAASNGPAIDDAWGTKIRIDRVAWNPRQFTVSSAGPDKKFGTADDLAMNVEVRGGTFLNRPDAGTIVAGIEHNHGPNNGLAMITGTVSDPTGAALPGATVQLVDTSAKPVRTTSADASGDFELAAVPPGDYDVRILSMGFRTSTRHLKIEARDAVALRASLSLGAISEVVEVMAAPAPRPMMMMDAVRARVGGVAAGTVGGVAGGMIGNAPAQPPGAAMLMAAKDVKFENKISVTANSPALQPAAHVRSYFPEALYINPEIITDKHGNATISIPMADSITTWRMAMLASTTRGALGSATSGIKVFQDFFADLDLPVTVTQGDRVSIPVAIYNYTGAAGDVHLKLKSEDWFSLVEDTLEKTQAVDSDRVGGSQFTIEAKRIGKFKLTLAANMNNRADIVVREIEVVPNGREQTVAFNGRLESSIAREISFPPSAIPEASSILLRLYPGPLSQVIEGMDAILRMPYGCFEQTSSSTYPNVLALDYMKRMKKSTPEVHAKAEGFISTGYQRLLTFEVPGGGFSWFGRAPANKILTSYGLMEFSDMSKVYDVDPKLIQRTQQWLAAQQQPDGSWKPDSNFINEGATNRYNTDAVRIAAYIAWSLENTGYRGPAVDKARQFISQHMKPDADSYTLAVIANFAADGNDREFLNRAIHQLVDAHQEQGELAWWTAEQTQMYGRGDSAAVETTGLAVQALLKSGESSNLAHKALSFLASKKDANGAWGSTQSTIMALRAILLSTEKGSADVRGTVEVSLNGATVQTLALTADNNDLLHQFVLKNVAAKNSVELRFKGAGGLAYQIAGRYFIPWTEKPANEPLSIRVDYDRTRLSTDDIATATAVVKNNTKQAENMVMVDLGIPPGFDLLSEDLQDFKEKTASKSGGRLEKFNLTATQAILYFDSIGAGNSVTIKFRLRAKFPVRARTFQSRAYEYYDPSVKSVAQPIQLEVRKR